MLLIRHILGAHLQLHTRLWWILKMHFGPNVMVYGGPITYLRLPGVRIIAAVVRITIILACPVLLAVVKRAEDNIGSKIFTAALTRTRPGDIIGSEISPTTILSVGKRGNEYVAGGISAEWHAD